MFVFVLFVDPKVYINTSPCKSIMSLHLSVLAICSARSASISAALGRHKHCFLSHDVFWHFSHPGCGALCATANSSARAFATFHGKGPVPQLCGSRIAGL